MPNSLFLPLFQCQFRKSKKFELAYGRQTMNNEIFGEALATRSSLSCPLISDLSIFLTITNRLLAGIPQIPLFGNGSHLPFGIEEDSPFQ